MKSIPLIILSLLFIVSQLQSQDNFKWDVVDSVALNKEQLYTNSKVFIAKTWKSAKDVIQSDDREGGVIVVKGLISKDISAILYTYTYNYGYMITFRMKDKKFKVTIEDVQCESTSLSNKNCAPKCIEPFEGDNCPSTGSFTCAGPSKSKATKMMESIKQDLDGIIDSYYNFLQNANKANTDDW